MTAKKEPPTFLALVDRLTRDTPAYVSRDHGKELHERRGLLQELREAVFEGMETGGGSSSFGSKPPIDAAAADLLTQITNQATEALAAVSKAVTPYGHAETYVRLWSAAVTEHQIVTVTERQTLDNAAEYAAQFPHRPVVYDEEIKLTAYDLLARWVAQIEDFFNPPSSREIKAPCPSCGTEFVYRKQDGHDVRLAALNFIRDKETGETKEARCSHCKASWSPDRFEWLARAIGATMLLSDIMAEYQPGDENGWENEFALLRKIHAKKLDALRESIRADGITTPVLLGYDGRVWDGHHRLCIAEELGITAIPISVVEEPRHAETTTV